MIDIRCVARGGAGRSVNPIQTLGVDYAPHTIAILSPRGYKNISTPMDMLLLAITGHLFYEKESHLLYLKRAVFKPVYFTINTL